MPKDIYDLVHPLMQAGEAGSPWHGSTGSRTFSADTALLEKMIGVPIKERADSKSGRLPKALDAWVAHELRRAGFDPSEVWPRLDAPRVLPREVAIFINKLPKTMRKDAWKRLLKDKTTAPASANVLGKAYVKQVDVVVSQWARGPEILISTKTMSSSFSKNIPNRFEEAYGDAKNLRGRHPLAAIGFVFLVSSSIHSEDKAAYERALDMMRKLKAEFDTYDSTALIIADWTLGTEEGIKVRDDLVPDDIGINRFFEGIIDAVLSRTPVDMHVDVREKREGRRIPLSDDDVATGIHPTDGE